MKTICRLLLLALLLSLPAAGRTNRLYLIGNSLTDELQYDDFRALAQGRGHYAPWTRHWIPGSPLWFLWDSRLGNGVDPAYGGPTNALVYCTWDSMSLQPFSASLMMDTNSICQFARLSLPRNTNMQIYVYAQWPSTDKLANGFEAWWTNRYVNFADGTYNTTREYYEKVLLNTRPHLITSMTHVARLLPVGDVLNELDKLMRAGQVPGFTSIVQFYEDTLHVTDDGSYVVACTFFAAMYRESPIGLPTTGYNVSSPALAALIQTTAWDVVRNNPYAGIQKELLPHDYNITVAEGGTAVLNLKLGAAPQGTLTVNVVKVSGSTDLSVLSNATLYFTAANYTTWQTVTLAAAEDADFLNKSAQLQLAGAGFVTSVVTVIENDNDKAAVCYESFDAPAGTLLSAVTGGYGWSGPWEIYGTVDRHTAPGLTCGALVTRGNKATDGGGWYNQGCGRSFDKIGAFAPWVTNGWVGKPGTELWMSYLITVSNQTANNLVSLDDAGALVHDNDGRCRIKQVAGQWLLSVNNDAYMATSSVSVVAGQTYLMVLRLAFGAPHTFELFINPPALGGTAPSNASAAITFSDPAFRFSDMMYAAGRAAIDELRFGGSFAVVTPTIMAVYTNGNNATVFDTYTESERSGTTIIYTGTLGGTGTYAQATGMTNVYVGVIAPGLSPGALTFLRQDGVVELGTPADPLTLMIEDGDVLTVTNLGAPLALANLDVTFLFATTLGDTNWFLEVADGFTDQFHATNFVMYTSGQVMYDEDNKRVGVWVVPEPGTLAAAALLTAVLVQRRR